MACGKPVIVSKTGGLPEKITPGVNGFVFEPGNEHQLAYYINELLSDAPLKKKMGAEALAMVQRDLTWHHVALRVMKLYTSLINGIDGK